MEKRKAISIVLPAVPGFAAVATADENMVQTGTSQQEMPVEEHNTENTSHSLIGDLALILLLGAVVTLLFKKLRQPVVLG